MRSSVLYLLLIALALAVPSFGEKPWTEVRSPHFRILTNGNAGDARKVAAEFEQLRYVFASKSANVRLESGAPLLIFAVRDEKTAEELEPRIWKSGMSRAGEFHHGWEKQFIILRLDTWGGQGSKEVVYHEYAHSIEHLNLRYLPVWLDEGLAEYYAYTRFESHRIYLGAPTERYRTMLGRVPLPVETILSVTPRSPYYIDGSKNQLFYADSWALVHYLIYGDGMENGKHFEAFVDLLEQGVEQKKAFEQEFGSFKEVDKALDAYMRRFAFSAVVFNDSPQVNEKDFAERQTTGAETEAELASLHIWTRDFKTAHALVEQAMKDDPGLGLSYQDQGFLDFSEDKDNQAVKDFTQAFERDNKLYLSLFYEAMLSPPSTSSNADDMKTFQAAMEKVLSINPDFAPAYVQLAKLAIERGNLELALGLSRKAEELEPSRAGYHLLSGQILKRMGKMPEAANFAKFVADRWVSPDHDEAVELWDSIPASARGNLELAPPPDSEFPPGTKKGEGTIKSVACEPNAGWTLVLTQNGHDLTFHGKSFRAGFSDTLWFGEDHFSPCHHVVGLRAVVQYTPAADSAYTGDVVEIGVRDDLPPAITR